MQIRPAIVGEYQDYKRNITGRANKVTESNNSFLVTDDLLVRSSYLGESGTYERILAGSHVDNNPYTPDEIKKHYLLSSQKFGPINEVEIQYVEQNEGGREVITKKSTDLLQNEVLSWEKVDATTGEVMEEWFIPNHKNRAKIEY